MHGDIFRIKSIPEMHEKGGYPPPPNPLISVVDGSSLSVPQKALGVKLIYDFYIIWCKDKSCGIEYGRNKFDFNEGVMTFSAPGQTFSPTTIIKPGEIKGWMLAFHQDLIRSLSLGNQIASYTFFNYEIFEALHLSEEEETIINDLVNKIKIAANKPPNDSGNQLIISNLELLLDYCNEFYIRQFKSRNLKNIDVVSLFEKELKSYFSLNQHLESGLPSIQYFAEKANLSQHYFSDLLKKETGRSPKDHINNYVIEFAKNLLWNTESSISEIAYQLGFNYPHYFTRLFKSITGYTPLEYRNMN